jgi:hypothetical protein
MGTVLVSRIPFGVKLEMLTQIFAPLGPKSMRNRPATPSESAPFEAIIEFSSRLSADAAILAMNGFCLAGRKLQVAAKSFAQFWAFPRAPRVKGVGCQVSTYEPTDAEDKLPAAWTAPPIVATAVSDTVRPEEALRVILRRLPNSTDSLF